MTMFRILAHIGYLVPQEADRDLDRESAKNPICDHLLRRNGAK